MKKLVVVLALILSLPATTALSHHKPGHHIPPGHLKKQLTPPATVTVRPEVVCFVQTAVPNDPYAEVVWSEWLPRPVAERKAETEGGFIIIHPTLQTEQDCRDFLWQ